MANFLINADTEREMREILDFFSLPDIIHILRAQIVDLPPEEQKFYSDEIDLWGALGDKQQLISAIINIAEAYVGINSVMELFDKFTQGLPPVEAQTRYMPHDVAEGLEWSQETSPEERLKWMKYYQYPGYYSREEKSLIQPHPEQDYADPELLQREMQECKVLGMGPIIPDAFPKLNELSSEEQTELRKLMESQILEAVQPRGAPAVPRPYLMEMVYDYLYVTNNVDAAIKFMNDGVSSRSRFGFNTNAILRRMFNEMPLEDLYLHWNSIVNYKELPWVDEQYALDRFGGGQLGKNIGPMYENWKEQEEFDTESVYIDWPEDLAWADRVSPSEAMQWEY